MKKCDYCGKENADEKVECFECGSRKFKGEISAPPSPKVREPFVFHPLSPEEMNKTLVTLIKCRTLLDADMLVAELESLGISAFIPDQFLMQDLGWGVGTYGFVRVQVSPKDYRESKEFLWEREQDSVHADTESQNGDLK